MIYLHDLRENTKGNCGVVLAGMPYFREHLKKAAARGKEGVSEFLRRINVWHELAGLSAGEIRYIVGMHGITNPERVRELSQCKCFGSLMNEIYLEKILNNQL